MKLTAYMVIISATACIAACAGGYAAIFIGGQYFPGYSQLKSTISQLGASASPVSSQISLCWIIAGLMIIFFGAGFKKAFEEKGRYATIAAWLIILYGLCEEIGSGVFKADHVAGGLTPSAIIHDSIGAIGVAAIILLPLIIQKVITKNESPAFHRFSRVIFTTGLLFLVLFLFRYSVDENNFFAVYKGAWQRLFVLNIYIYLVAISVIVIRKTRFRAVDKSPV
jgi:uncharacterized membrane protein YozB (DUF420 family)